MAPDEAERIAIDSDADVVTARQRARALAVTLEMPSTDQTLLATAISEIAVASSVWSVLGISRPTASARARWRAVTTSASDSIAIRSAASGAKEPRL